MPANTTLSPQQALIVRLAIGLVFGLGLAWLTDQPGAARMDRAAVLADAEALVAGWGEG